VGTLKESKVKGRLWMGAVLGVLLGAAAFSVPLYAQWTGEIGAGYVWQTYAGNQNVFISQYGLRPGWVLDNFELAYAPKTGGPQTFGIEASGFGGALPDQHAFMFFNAGGGWRFTLGYDRQYSFFNVPVGSFNHQNDQWAIQRWKGSAVWDGWSAARLTLNLRYTDRTGYSYRPFFGMATQYAMQDNYDQTMKEAAFRIETKTLPVYISFEQAYARYERNDQWTPASPYPLYGQTQNWLVGLQTPRQDTTNVPSSRLILAYRNDWVDVAGSFLYTKADMDSTGYRTSTFAIQQGTVGQAQYIDSLLGSASQDTRAANVDAAFQLGSGWSITLAGDYKNATQDANLYGTNAVVTKYASFSQQVLDNTFFDVKDSVGRIEVMKKGSGWAAWGGYQALTRDISYGNSYVDPNVKRTGDGWFVGGSWSKTPALVMDAEYQHGTFDQYAFRTDPDLAQSFVFHLNSRLGGGWQIGARARWVQATNPADLSNLRRQAQSAGITAAWSNQAGTAGFGFTADSLSIKARTNTYLPVQNEARVPWVSIYNTDVLSIGTNGHLKVGHWYFDADLAYLRNSGETQPVTAWNGGLKAAVDIFKGGQLILFGQYRSYVEEMNILSMENYYVRRYGVSLRWRF
jgi:hypothetical protein